MKVKAPVDASAISTFMASSEKRYVTALNEVKSLLSTAKKSMPELSCVYSIYSRGEKQFGNELKHPRKIRLKINKYMNDTKSDEYDIFSMPDIVGVTVAVAFPTDINTVNAVIDKWIADANVFAVYSDSDNASKNISRKIQTVFGNVRQDGGYNACHYYLRTKKTDWEPIVEVQVKTLLHDAWGLLTHDLTYKPPIKLDRDLLAHFSILGDQLSKIDSQGDILRKTISRSTKVRATKKRAVQVATLESSLVGICRSAAEMGNLLNEINARTTAHGRIECTNEQLAGYAKQIVAFFNEEPAGACLMLCLLAVLSDDTRTKLQALEYIDIWALRVRDQQEIAKAKSYAHLAHFCFSDTPTAIELAEEALRGLRQINRPIADGPEEERFKRRENSLLSSLAYYHAEIVGSDEGTKRTSHKVARDYALESVAAMVELKLLDAVEANIEANVASMFRIASSPGYSGPIFHTIDNLIFVLVQTASTVAELDAARTLLDNTIASHPTDLGTLPKLLMEFHMYCARQRLTELELQDVDG